MALLARKGLLAIAAVIDVALHGQGRPVSAKALALRHALPARHMEPVLQALVHGGILRGVRGPRGGYTLARDSRHISADEVLRATGAIEEGNGANGTSSVLIDEVIIPAISRAEQAFATALGHISIDELTRLAESLRNVAL